MEMNSDPWASEENPDVSSFVIDSELEWYTGRCTSTPKPGVREPLNWDISRIDDDDTIARPPVNHSDSWVTIDQYFNRQMNIAQVPQDDSWQSIAHWEPQENANAADYADQRTSSSSSSELTLGSIMNESYARYSPPPPPHVVHPVFFEPVLSGYLFDPYFGTWRPVYTLPPFPLPPVTTHL